MAEPKSNQRLSSLDASFLYYERKEAPLNIGGIHIFESEIPYEEFIEHVSSKLPLLPRYRQIVRLSPLNTTQPTWEPDTNFDIHRHIFDVKLEAPGTIDQLRALAGQVHCGMLDRNKPLWELYLVQGYEGHRTVMISKIHHAMVDGISGVDLLNVTLDFSPNPTHKGTKPPEPKEAFSKHPHTMFDSLLDYFEDNVKTWTSVQTQLLWTAEKWLKQPDRLLSPQNLGALGNIVSPISMLPFNRPLSGKIKLIWSNYSFAEIKAIRAAIGGTVNDVVLTALAKAFADYLEERDFPTRERVLRIMVPVSMRPDEQRGALGNQVSLLPVEIPLDMADPMERHTYVIEKTQALKNTRIADAINLFSNLLGVVPPALQAAVGSIVDTPVAIFNIVCTNVPGPQVPLYLMGRKMTESFPYVPIGFAVGISVSIFSYNGMLYMGITADAESAPDADKLKGFLDSAFAEIRTAAGLTAKPQKTEAVPVQQTPAVKAESQVVEAGAGAEMPELEDKPAKPKAKAKASKNGAKPGNQAEEVHLVTTVVSATGEVKKSETN
ncbi:MAG TPA: wax ester/triacylglycerol synthase family O-acyltransferase [Chloroflexia bacterium]|nr:wax ester/triacylglycerol synthase family O-acyltransferase [Chloroflexia bacterium]